MIQFVLTIRLQQFYYSRFAPAFETFGSIGTLLG